MIKSKAIPRFEPSVKSKDPLTGEKHLDAREAEAHLNYLMQAPEVSLEPEERDRDSLSAPLIPTCNRQLTPQEINHILNTQIPKKWRRRISGIIWTRE